VGAPQRVAEVLGRIDEWPVDGPTAAGVVRADEVIATHGDAEEVLPWASVTKLVSAYTVLMTVDEGIIDLDGDAGPEGSTVRHLLAHAAGLAFDGDGQMANPGERRIYSNVGFEKLGAHISERTGIGFGELVAENVLEPLGMGRSSYGGSPAHGVEGPLVDVLTFAQELCAPTLVSEDLFREATSVQFEGIGGVLPGFGRQEPNDWGLGFELRDRKDPHWTGRRNSPETFGHFGLTGSFLWVDPEAGIACASLAARDFGDWANEAWTDLSDAIIDACQRS
jgi:CubicO group peptidase (beta-lactamase class C family)